MLWNINLHTNTPVCRISMLWDWTIATGGNYEKIKPLLQKRGAANGDVYTYATFMQPRGILVTKRDISPEGWDKLGFGGRMWESIWFPRGRPFTPTSPFDWWKERKLPVTVTSRVVPANYKKVFNTDSDDIGTWYEHEVYDLVGVPIDINVAQNATGPPVSAPGVATDAGPPSEYTKLAKAAKTGTSNSFKTVKSIAAKYIEGKLASRDEIEISNKIDTLIALVDLDKSKSYYSQIKSSLEVIQKWSKKSAGRKANKTKRENQQKEIREKRDLAKKKGALSLDIAKLTKQRAEDSLSVAKEKGGITVDIARLTKQRGEEAASVAKKRGEISLEVAQGAAKVSLSKAKRTENHEKARILLAQFQFYVQDGQEDNAANVMAELNRMMGEGEISDAKVVSAIISAKNLSTPDAEDQPEDQPETGFSGFVRECMVMDRDAPRMDTGSAIDAERGQTVDTAAGPLAAAVMIYMEDSGAFSATYYDTNMAPLANPVNLAGTERITVVLLGYFGKYTADVIRSEREQTGESGGYGYWFPQEMIKKILGDPQKAYTKTTVSRVLKWIDRLRLGSDVSGMELKEPSNTDATRQKPPPVVNQMETILQDTTIIGNPDHIYVGSNWRPRGPPRV